MIEFPRLLIAPQWQGSAADSAGLLPAGAHRLATLFSAAQATAAEVDSAPSALRAGVRNLDALIAARAAITRSLADWGAQPLLTLGGDCGIEQAPIARALARHGDGLAVVWLDAHADLNTPESSPSGAFHGMVLRSLLGDGPAELRPDHRLNSDRVVLAGVRSVDPAEAEFIAANGIRRLSVAELADSERLVAAVAATGARAVYIHLDLDVLDPAHLGGLSFPEPDGASPDDIRAALDALATEFRIAGLGITEYAPGPTVAADDAVLRAMLGMTKH
ncbi:arginase family protein [Nocardia panacis]|uniref:Arginase family protein n=1 Tax=Nocardia panacis TaxID=2340916 RepID=A0A3A4KLB6_9NOCA|nr:arginase family protein [Nocardia panacis]RJO73767.1 arginase family protein [Nocardia panacis]